MVFNIDNNCFRNFAEKNSISSTFKFYASIVRRDLLAYNDFDLDGKFYDAAVGFIIIKYPYVIYI